MFGLEGNAVDDADDVGNLAAGMRDHFHGGDHVGDFVTALGCHLRCGAGQRAGLLRRVGVLAHGGGLLLHGGGGFFQAGAVCSGAAGWSLFAAAISGLATCMPVTCSCNIGHPPTAGSESCPAWLTARASRPISSQRFRQGRHAASPLAARCAEARFAPGRGHLRPMNTSHSNRPMAALEPPRPPAGRLPGGQGQHCHRGAQQQQRGRRRARRWAAPAGHGRASGRCARSGRGERPAAGNALRGNGGTRLRPLRFQGREGLGTHRQVARHLPVVAHGRRIGAHPVVVAVFCGGSDQ